MMRCFTKALAILSVVFGLSIAGADVTTVSWDAPASVVGEVILGAVATAPLAAQLECGWCTYDAGEDEHIFISFVICDGGGGGTSAMAMDDEDGCRVCIDDALLGGGDLCEWDHWQEGKCPRFDCGPGDSDIVQALLASARGDWEAVVAFAERFAEHVEYDPGMAAFAVTNCALGARVYVPSSPLAAMLIGLAHLRGAD